MVVTNCFKQNFKTKIFKLPKKIINMLYYQYIKTIIQNMYIHDLDEPQHKRIA